VSFLNLILNVFYHEKELKDSKKRRIIQRNSTFRNKQTNNRNFLFLKAEKIIIFSCISHLSPGNQQLDLFTCLITLFPTPQDG